MVVGCVRQGYRNFSRLGSKPNPCASPRGFFFPQGHARLLLMATGKKDGGREAELEAAIEKIRLETWKAGQTLPKLRHAIALILQELKADGERLRTRIGRERDDPDT